MIACTLKSVMAWAIMLLLSVNIIGFVMRGLVRRRPFLPPSIPTGRLRVVVERESRRLVLGNVIITLLSVGFAAGFLYALFYFWNLGLALAAAMMMLGRLPDLLYEIRTGQRLPVYHVGTLLVFCALPLTWYSLCKWE